VKPIARITGVRRSTRWRCPHRPDAADVLHQATPRPLARISAEAALCAPHVALDLADDDCDLDRRDHDQDDADDRFHEHSLRAALDMTLAL